MTRVRQGVLLGLCVVLFGAAYPAAAERLLVPGGAATLRRVTGIPDHVPDSMLLSEAARAWFGVRVPAPADARHASELAAYLATSKEPLQPGPWLPLSAATWMRLLDVKAPGDIALALVRNRNAMLLYRGLVGMDDETLGWLGAHDGLLSDILTRTAPAFATAGPSIVVAAGAVAVPGGRSMIQAWSTLVGESPLEPAEFIKRLLGRENGRIAWMYSVLATLDPARLRFAAGENGSRLPALAVVFANVAQEWDIRDRAFSRPPFDPSVPLALIDVSETSPPGGTDEFWREVFRSDDQQWRDRSGGAPLTGATLLDILFGGRGEMLPAHARTRWEIFSLGQRMLRGAQPDREAGLALRVAQRFPVIAVSLERMGVLTPAMLQQLAAAATRISKLDADGQRGDLAPWQAALVTVERSAISGGLDAQETTELLTSFARLSLNGSRRELTAWVVERWLDRLLSRPGAPSDAEEALLRTMAGDLTRTGDRQVPEFSWEDLEYDLAAERHAFTRMREARSAQGGPTLSDARGAWSGTSEELSAICKRLQAAGDDAVIEAAAKRLATALSTQKTERVERERRELADAIVGRALPRIAYVPQQAASDVPTLGGDLALRHEFVTKEGPQMRRQRSWNLATPIAFEGQQWHLSGALLSLDLPLSTWYLRTNGDAPMDTPTIEDPDVSSLSLVAVLGSPDEVARLATAADAIDAGRTQAAASPDLHAFDALLAACGIDPWRRRALRVDATSPSEAAERMTPSEAWRIGRAGDTPIAPRLALDGCACLGSLPLSTTFVEGRPSNGMVGAIVPGLSLRILGFLQSRRLPIGLYRLLAGGVAFDVIHGARAVRTDDLEALDVAAARISDARLEEHVLALIADGTLAAPSAPTVVH